MYALYQDPAACHGGRSRHNNQQVLGMLSALPSIKRYTKIGRKKNPKRRAGLTLRIVSKLKIIFYV